MDLRVIIPVKPFGEAKQRLSPVLDTAERAQLAERMFRHVFGVASARFGRESVLVVSRSPDVLALAQSQGGIAVPEHAPCGLNAAVSQALRVAAGSRVLVIASDLPLMNENDLA